MGYLIAVSLIWAFSFGLIKGNLTGLDSNVVSFARMLISLIVFLPFFAIAQFPGQTGAKIFAGQCVAIRMMYLAYIYSFQHLKAYEVALFTIFTPIYVTLLNDVFRQKFNGFHLLMAALAVFGTGVIVFHEFARGGFWLGFWVVQLSNICFAFGQIYYRELMQRHRNLKDREIFGLLYLGAVLLTGFSSIVSADLTAISLVYPNPVSLPSRNFASGVCFLWNFGARQVNAGSLAVANNLKCRWAWRSALLVFGESADVPRLLIGGGIILAALLVTKNGSRFAKSANGRPFPIDC
ncbi:MAG: DMT family transporter [Calditrichia bacterium]